MIRGSLAGVCLFLKLGVGSERSYQLSPTQILPVYCLSDLENPTSSSVRTYRDLVSLIHSTPPVTMSSIANAESLDENSPPTSWVKGALLNPGSTGNVYLGMSPDDGFLVAVKEVALPPVDRGRTAKLEVLANAVAALRALHHENIAEYFSGGVDSADPDHFRIFLEYVPGGSIRSLLDNYGPFEESLALNFTKQILAGLSYLHAQSVIHRALRGSHILTDNKGCIKLTGFGLPRREDEQQTSVAPPTLGHRRTESSLQRSVYWLSPEQAQGAPYSATTDIWSMGCVIIEMISGSHPYAPLTPLQAIFRLGQGQTPFLPDSTPQPLQAFLGRLLIIDAEHRPSAATLLEDACLNST